MKKVFSILFVAVVVTLVACSGKKSDLVAGAWKVGDMSSEAPKELPDSLKKVLEVQSKAQCEEMKKSCTFEFNKDGSYSVKMMGNQTKGKWQLSDDATQMTLVEDSTKEKAGIVSKVVELSASKMVFSMENSGLKQSLTLIK